MDTPASASPLNDKEKTTGPRLVVPSCCGVPKRATDLCDHFRIRPPITAYDGD